MIPAKGEGAADQLPMPSDGLVTSHLLLRPAQGMFDVDVGSARPTCADQTTGSPLPDWLEETAARFQGVALGQAGW